jgi:hypothetical protein
MRATLPGQAIFIARTLHEAMASGTCTVRLARAWDLLIAAFESHVHREGVRRLVKVDCREADFLQAISSEVNCRRPTAAAILSSKSLQDTVLIVQAGERSDADLDLFARLARQKGRDIGLAVLIVMSASRAPCQGVPSVDARGVAGPLDGATYAAKLPRRTSPFIDRVLSSIAIELAGWACEIQDSLSELSVKDALRPDLCVAVWTAGAEACWRGRPRAWEAGTLDDWGGEEVEHPLWLAANQPAALTKRVWRGQLPTLLPWIERHRLEIIDRYRRRLSPDPVRSGEDLDMLDWGPLRIQLSRFAGLDRFIQVFREARNELAHGRPISWPLLKACLDQTQQTRE